LAKSNHIKPPAWDRDRGPRQTAITAPHRAARRNANVAQVRTADTKPPAWQCERPRPRRCVIPGCGKEFVPGHGTSNSKTCSPECSKELERIGFRKHYKRNAAKIIAANSARRRRRHRPIIKRCMAPGCGKEFVAKNKAKTCSREYGIKRRWALQRDRYHANQISTLAYKRKWLAANREKVRARERKRHRTMALRRDNRYYAKLGTRRKYRTANREKLRAQARRHYAANREKIRAQDRKLRRAMALRRDNRYYAHLAYMRKYRAANREKINAYARRWHAKKRRKTALA
jgi:hypothetical protein